MFQIDQGWITPWVTRLTRDSTHPVDVLRLLQDMKIPIVEQPKSELSRTGEARKTVSSGFEIVLFKASTRDRQLTAVERFTLAHELGHILLEREYGIRPTTEEEYWSSEDWCDAFAAKLLVPNSMIPREQKPEPLQALFWIIEIENTCLVPWEAAARRIVETHERLCFISLRGDNEGERATGLRTVWVASSGITAPLRRNQLLTDRDPLSRTLLELSGVEAHRPRFFPIPHGGRGVIRKCPPHWGVPDDLFVVLSYP